MHLLHTVYSRKTMQQDYQIGFLSEYIQIEKRHNPEPLLYKMNHILHPHFCSYLTVNCGLILSLSEIDVDSTNNDDVLSIGGIVRRKWDWKVWTFYVDPSDGDREINAAAFSLYGAQNSMGCAIMTMWSSGGNFIGTQKCSGYCLNPAHVNSYTMDFINMDQCDGLCTADVTFGIPLPEFWTEDWQLSIEMNYANGTGFYDPPVQELVVMDHETLHHGGGGQLPWNTVIVLTACLSFLCLVIWGRYGSRNAQYTAVKNVECEETV